MWLLLLLLFVRPERHKIIIYQILFVVVCAQYIASSIDLRRAPSKQRTLNEQIQNCFRRTCYCGVRSPAHTVHQITQSTVFVVNGSLVCIHFVVYFLSTQRLIKQQFTAQNAPSQSLLNDAAHDHLIKLFV